MKARAMAKLGPQGCFFDDVRDARKRLIFQSDIYDSVSGFGKGLG